MYCCHNNHKLRIETTRKANIAICRKPIGNVLLRVSHKTTKQQCIQAEFKVSETILLKHIVGAMKIIEIFH